MVSSAEGGKPAPRQVWRMVSTEVPSSGVVMSQKRVVGRGSLQASHCGKALPAKYVEGEAWAVAHDREEIGAGRTSESITTTRRALGRVVKGCSYQGTPV